MMAIVASILVACAITAIVLHTLNTLDAAEQARDEASQ